MAPDEILLLKLIKQGDEQAFRFLFDQYFVALCRFVNVYLDCHEESEELALDVFAYVWEHRTELEIRLSLKAYLFQMARNRSLNLLRDRRQEASLEELAVEPVEEGGTRMEIEELNRLIEEAVCALPDRCREVFLKSRREERSNAEIAQEMDISVKTVEAQITKALKLIRKHLGEGYAYLF